MSDPGSLCRRSLYAAPPGIPRRLYVALHSRWLWRGICRGLLPCGAALTLTFTYFAPGRPPKRLDDREYAAKHCLQTKPTEVVDALDLEQLYEYVSDRAREGRKGDAGY